MKTAKKTKTSRTSKTSQSSKSHKSYRFPLEPTEDQETLLTSWVDTARLVWNVGLEQRREYLQRGKFINYNKQSAELTNAKHDTEYAPYCSFLKDPPSDALQHTLQDLQDACDKHSVGKVHFKSKRHNKLPGLHFPTGERFKTKKLNKNHSLIRIPKLGWVKYRSSRKVLGTIRNATITCVRGKWFISLLTESIAKVISHKNKGSIIGVDRGVTVALALSDGSLWDKKASTPREIKRYKRLQQKLARQRKGSKNRRKTLNSMAKLREREINRRTNFINKCAHTLTDLYHYVAIEKLDIQSMTKSAKGTKDTPSRKVKQKSGLNRAILSKGWYQFEVRLRQKAQETGSQVVEVNPKNTSQICSKCYYQAQENRESQAIFLCKNCNHMMNADVNAAINIRTRGQTVVNRDYNGGLPVEAYVLT